MSFSRLPVTCFVVPFLFVALESLHAAEYKKGDKVLVTADAQLKLGAKPVGTVQKGDRLTIQGVQGKWLWVKTGTVSGWIDSGNVSALPMDDSVAEGSEKPPVTVELTELGEASIDDEPHIGVLITVSATESCKTKIAKKATFVTTEDDKKLPITYIHMLSSRRTAGSVSGPAVMSGITFELGGKTYRCFSPFATQAVQLVDDEAALSISFKTNSKIELALLFKGTSSALKSISVLGRELPAKSNVPVVSEKTRPALTHDMEDSGKAAMAGGNLRRTGFYPSASIRECKGVKWKFASKSGIDSSPVVSNGTVYVGSLDGSLYALEIESGELKWQFRTEDKVFSAPAIADGTVYFGSDDHFLYALEADSGKVTWKFQAQDAVSSSPAVSAGVVYFGSDDSCFYAVDSRTGTLKWKYATEGAVFSSPAMAQTAVFFGSYDGHIYALDSASGDLRWKYKTDDKVISTPVIGGNNIYFGSADSHLYAIDVASGALAWKFQAGDSIISSSAVDQHAVYTACVDGKLYSIDKASGRQRWTVPMGLALFSSPTIAERVVYLGSSSGDLYAIDVENGKTLWKTSVGGIQLSQQEFGQPFRATVAGVGRSAPAIVDRVIYVGSKDGNLYAVH